MYVDDVRIVQGSAPPVTTTTTLPPAVTTTVPPAVTTTVPPAVTTTVPPAVTTTTSAPQTTTTALPPATTTTVAPPPPPGPGGLAVYTDGLGTGWADWSWATRNMAATAPALGARSIVWEPDVWTGVYLRADAVAQAAGSVRFSMHGNGTGGQAVNVIVAVNGVQRVSASVASLGGAIRRPHGRRIS